MYALALSYTLAVALAQPPLGGPTQAQSVFTGLRHEDFFAVLNLGIREQAIDPRGVYYKLDPRGRFSSLRVILSVNYTTELARKTFLFFEQTVSVGPQRRDEPIGDDFALWLSGPDATKIDPVLRQNGTVLLRRGNIVLAFTWRGTLQDALDLVREADHLIQTNREIAPIGEFDEAPEIVAVPLAAEDDADAERTVTPIVRGLGDPGKVRFAAEVGFFETLSDDRQSIGKLKIRIPKNNDQTEIRIIAASEENVFTSKIVSIRIRGGIDRGHPPGWRGNE